jgi:lysylphosphatidylglycerol synthetase-like protein (DUF2156 family)
MAIEAASQTTPLDDEAEKHKKNPIVSAIITVFVGLILAIATVTGFISATIAVIIFVLVLVAMVIFHGGGADIVSGLSDAEGYERELEEEEQRKTQEAEESGEDPGESH